MKSITVVIKHPGELPYTTAIPDTLDELRRLIDGGPETAMSHKIAGRQSVVWCDSRGSVKRPAPKLNIFRPRDFHPLRGTLVVCALEGSIDGMINASLSSREAALWRAVLLVRAPECSAWLDDPTQRAHAEAILHDVDGTDWPAVSAMISDGANAMRLAAAREAVVS